MTMITLRDSAGSPYQTEGPDTPLSDALKALGVREDKNPWATEEFDRLGVSEDDVVKNISSLSPQERQTALDYMNNNMDSTADTELLMYYHVLPRTREWALRVIQQAEENTSPEAEAN